MTDNERGERQLLSLLPTLLPPGSDADRGMVVIAIATNEIGRLLRRIEELEKQVEHELASSSA